MAGSYNITIGKVTICDPGVSIPPYTNPTNRVDAEKRWTHNLVSQLCTSTEDSIHRLSSCIQSSLDKLVDNINKGIDELIEDLQESETSPGPGNTDHIVDLGGIKITTMVMPAGPGTVIGPWYIRNGPPNATVEVINYDYGGNLGGYGAHWGNGDAFRGIVGTWKLDSSGSFTGYSPDYCGAKDHKGFWIRYKVTVYPVTGDPFVRYFFEVWR